MYLSMQTWQAPRGHRPGFFTKVCSASDIVSDITPAKSATNGKRRQKDEKPKRGQLAELEGISEQK
jgi:hypothetical protein